MTGTNEVSVAELITAECNALRDMLIEKNRKYGNSAIEPMRIASRASAEEQILVRIDDKLSRLRSAQPDETEDVWSDLLGYIILLKVCRTLRAHEQAQAQVQTPRATALMGCSVVSRATQDRGKVTGTAESASGELSVAVSWDDGTSSSFDTFIAFDYACCLVPR